jgi:hypothetical protein
VKRIRWFAAKWPIALRTLANKMKSHPFREDSLNGFIIDRVRDNFVNGRYVEKISYQETVTTPFGEQQVFDRTEYRQLEFNLFSAFPHMEFWDAPRSTQSYVSKLMELNNFSLTITPLSIDLLKWVASFQAIIKAKVTIDSLQISGLELEPDVTARFSIAGNKDVREALQKFTKGKRFELERVQLQLLHEASGVSLQLINTGAAKLEESLIEDFLPALRQSLPAPLASE